MLIGRAPVRLSFSGGGTDLASYYEKFGGRVVSATINRFFYVHLTQRQDELVQITSSDFRQNIVFPAKAPPASHYPFEIPLAALETLSIPLKGFDMFMGSQIPPGSGLGSSGAVAVNVVNVLSSFSGKALAKNDLAEMAYKIGHDRLGLPIGKQDEYAAAFGGINEFVFSHDKVLVRPVVTDSVIKRNLEKKVMLFFLGQTRNACEILKDQDSRTSRGDPATLEALHHSKELALETRKTIEAGDVETLGKLMDLSWEAKKKYSDQVTNPRVEMFYRAARRAGASGGKLTGAGGSGHMMLCCEEEAQRRVQCAMEELGASRILFRLEPEGARVQEMEFNEGC
jgi:D-glycero-alpha-D-manno-heptose-7-phosphate kinase